MPGLLPTDLAPDFVADRATAKCGTKANDGYTQRRIVYGDALGDADRGLLNDPQTSGGLLVSVPGERVDEFVELALEAGSSCAAVVGSVDEAVPGGPSLTIS